MPHFLILKVASNMEEQNNNIENIQEAIIQNEGKQTKQKKKKAKIIVFVVAIITVISVVAMILFNNLINTCGDSLMYVPTRVKTTYEDGLLLERIGKEEFNDLKYETVTRYVYNEKRECISETIIQSGNFILSHSYQYDEVGHIKLETYNEKNKYFY